MTITLHGIPHCDTVKKARAWFDDRGAAYRFHDFKKQGVGADMLARWATALGDWRPLLNRSGTTWRRLDASRQAQVVDADSAFALMLEQPSAIKRPVVVAGDAVIVGFDPDRYASLLVGSP